MATISSPGIGSNLDVNGIVSQLMSVEQQPLAALQQKQASYNAQLSAIGSVKGALSSFQSVLRSLSDVSKFESTTATTSDAAVVTAATGKGVVPGTYAIEVKQLAQPQKLASAGFADTSTPLGGGVLTFDLGTITGTVGSDGKYASGSFKSNENGTSTVTIDPAKSSLADIRDAINTANFGVKATIVNDGGETPYRLVLSSNKTGASNSIQIKTDSGSPLAAHFTHDVTGGSTSQAFTETATAQNALFTVDGVSISKTTNTADDVVAGLTFSLNKTNVGSKVNITVAQDTAGVQGAVGQFVFAYNQVMSTLRGVSAYDPATKRAAVLNGDPAIRSIQTAIRGMLNTPVAGGASAFTALPQIGVTIQKDGTMALDNAKLSAAITSNGSQIAGLFAGVGSTSDNGVKYVTSTTDTVANSYELNITKMATQASVTSTGPSSLNFSDGVDDILTVNVNGLDVNVKLKAGTYDSADDLAADLQSKINGYQGMASGGHKVLVVNNGGVMSLSSNLFGSTSSITIGGSAADKLFGANPTKILGQDVAGSFAGAIGTGSGQTLTGAAKSPSAGLQIQVTSGTASARGTVNYSKGYAAQLDSLVSEFLGTTGAVASKVDGINASLKTLTSKQQTLSDRLDTLEKRYRTQFTALDVSLSSMTSTSNYLAQQLAALQSSLG